MTVSRQVQPISAREYLTDALLLPFLFVLSLMLVSLPLLKTVIWFLCKMTMHELGHAIVYWLGGWLAVPCIFFGFTLPLGNERSLIASMLYFFILVFFFLLAYRRRYLFLQILCGLFIYLFLFFLLVLNERSFKMLTIYGGLGGELYLSTLLILFYHYGRVLGDSWKSKRILLLFLGITTFASSCALWWKVYFMHSSLPWGGMWKGFGVADGDLERLRDEFSWNESYIAGVYASTAAVCLFILLLHFSYLMLMYFKEKRVSAHPAPIF